MTWIALVKTLLQYPEMKPEPKYVGAIVFDLDVARQRRYYVSLAHNDTTWNQIKASFAISGIDLDDSVAEIIGRKIAAKEARE